MSRAGAKARRAERALRAEAQGPAIEHPSPRCPLRPERYALAAQGDRPFLRCTCAWDLAR